MAALGFSRGLRVVVRACRAAAGGRSGAAGGGPVALRGGADRAHAQGRRARRRARPLGRARAPGLPLGVDLGLGLLNAPPRSITGPRMCVRSAWTSG